MEEKTKYSDSNHAENAGHLENWMISDLSWGRRRQNKSKWFQIYLVGKGGKTNCQNTDKLCCIIINSKR